MVVGGGIVSSQRLGGFQGIMFVCCASCSGHSWHSCWVTWAGFDVNAMGYYADVAVG